MDQDQTGSVLPLGILYNNPGRLEKDGVRKEGETVPADQELYEGYETPLDGLKALAGRLRGYKDAKNTDGTPVSTLRHVVEQFAPESRADTTSYAYVISTDAKIDSDKPFDFDNRETLVGVMKAIVNHENGDPYTYGYPANWYPDDLYLSAVKAVSES